MTGFDLFGGVSKADDGIRSAFDFYATPDFMTRSLLHFHPDIRGRHVLECCSGDDAITRVLREAGCEVITNDFDARHPAMQQFDATLPWYWRNRAPDVDYIVTNPPFDVAMPILQEAVAHARIGVAFLLRKTFLEPTQERGPWLQAHPPTRIIGEPRYSFRGGSVDSVSCDWMLWLRQPIVGLRPFEIDYAADRRVR